MILHGKPCGKVGRRRNLLRKSPPCKKAGFFASAIRLIILNGRDLDLIDVTLQSFRKIITSANVGPARLSGCCSSRRYQAKPSNNSEIRFRLLQLAEQRWKYGSPRLDIVLLREDYRINGCIEKKRALPLTSGGVQIGRQCFVTNEGICNLHIPSFVGPLK